MSLGLNVICEKRAAVAIEWASRILGYLSVDVSRKGMGIYLTGPVGKKKRKKERNAKNAHQISEGRLINSWGEVFSLGHL
jgi:hypothetical protein